MPRGLPVSRLINVQVVLTPLAAQFLNFDSLLIMGDSDVIDTNERIRLYGSLAEVTNDFGSTVPEFLAAELFFSQIPQPSALFIGRWAQSATSGVLHGGVLTPAEQALSNFSAADAGFHIDVDGTGSVNIGPIDLSSGILNLNSVATKITTALTATGATCLWDGQRFNIKSGTTGVNSSISDLTAPTSGTDISGLLKMTAALASPTVVGIAAETALEAATIMDNNATSFYGLMFASTHIVDADHEAIAAFIQGSGNPHMYGVSTTATTVLDSTNSSDIASVLSAAGYTRTFVQYSANPYAVASFFGRAFTVNFAMNNSTITMMYKVEPGVAPELLTSAQAATLERKRCNVFVTYNNNTSIIEDGFMSGPAFFDEIHGLDWLANQAQTDIWNLLYTSPTKVPQTDPGEHQIATAIEHAMDAGVNNGLIAPGQWNSPGFGQLRQGDLLDKGYYVYEPPVASQAQADREARKSVPFQVAVKLAGAVHSVDCTINVNR